MRHVEGGGQCGMGGIYAFVENWKPELHTFKSWPRICGDPARHPALHWGQAVSLTLVHSYTMYTIAHLHLHEMVKGFDSRSQQSPRTMGSF
jgi:hypothetical protein